MLPPARETGGAAAHQEGGCRRRGVLMLVRAVMREEQGAVGRVSRGKVEEVACVGGEAATTVACLATPHPPSLLHLTRAKQAAGRQQAGRQQQ
mmetsp:Transcript_2250/g.5043  ORF Transcript_2250/g.5043 Transcript_2250/m.5043 type:complete len:93 (+) Transcript_2250:686-964(+)